MHGAVPHCQHTSSWRVALSSAGGKLAYLASRGVRVMAFCIGHEPGLKLTCSMRCIGLPVAVRVWVWNLVSHTEGRAQTKGGTVAGGERRPSRCDVGGQIETLVVA